MSDIEVLESQKLLLVDLVESYFVDLKKMGKSWGDHAISNEAWSKMAVVVNETGPHHKDANGWKGFFEKIKSEAKQKVGAHRQYINKTGSGLPPVQLNDVDYKLASLYGKNHFDGLQGLHECGFLGRKFASNPTLNGIPEKPLQTENQMKNPSNRYQNVTSRPTSKNRPKKRSFDSSDMASQKCNSCGGPGGNTECRPCNKIYCDECDDLYHRHPLRQTHIRKKIGNERG